MWSCRDCTYHNDDANIYCQMCNRRRQQRVTQHSAGYKSKTAMEEENAIEDWTDDEDDKLWDLVLEHVDDDGNIIWPNVVKRMHTFDKVWV